MTFDEYSAIDAINWSSLKHLRTSPLAYQHALQAPREDTAALALGRAAHTLIFEPHLFEAEFALWEGDRRGKEWAQFKADNEGRTILKTTEIDDIAAMADAVRRHPLVSRYFSGAEFEQTMVWTDPRTGAACKARADWMQPANRILLDFKTCRSVDGRRFGAEAARWGYHLQLAHYRFGCAHALGWSPRRVLIVAAEKTAPFDVAVFEVDSMSLELAEAELSELMDRLISCRQAGQWPGRYTEEQALQLPAWIYADDEDDADGFGLSSGDY